MIDLLKRLTDWIFKGGNVTYKEATLLSEISEKRDIITLISFANIIREEIKGTEIDFCANINVKTEECRDNCGICFQPAHYDIDAGDSIKIQKEFITKTAEEALVMGVNKFNIVFCGRNIHGKSEFDSVKKILKNVSGKIAVEPCVSLGMLTGGNAAVFKRLGIEDDSNNLDAGETLEKDIERATYFNEKLHLLEKARAEGFNICSGVTCGVGETQEQRIILAYALRELNVDSISLQFSAPGKQGEPLSPIELLKIIAIFRFIHPHRDITIGGKRWSNFKTIRPLIHLSGANAVMIGNFLAGTSKNALEGIKNLDDLMLVN